MKTQEKIISMIFLACRFGLEKRKLNPVDKTAIESMIKEEEKNIAYEERRRQIQTMN